MASNWDQYLANWKKAYPYIASGKTGVKLGDYTDSRRKYLDSWTQANPYNGLNPTSYGQSQAEMEAAGNATDASRQAFGEYDAYGQQAQDQWRNTLTPEQRAEYDALKDADYAKKQRMGQMAFLAAAGAMAAPGLMGAMGAGSGGGAVGLGEGAMGLGTEGVGMLGGGYGGAMGAGMEGAGALGAGGGAAGGLGGLGMFGTDLTAGGLAGMVGETGGLGGTEWLGGLGGAGGAGAGGGGAGGLLEQIQNAIKGGGSVTDALKGLGGSTNWLNLLGNLGAGWLGSNAAKDASQAQIDAAREANALLKYMYDTSRSDQAPYREAGTSALAGIQSLLKDPSSITSMPDYQFGLDQGNKSLANSAAARGMTYSGQQGKALQRYGQDYAGTKLNESYNRLAGIAGIGQQATNQSGALGQQYGQAAANNITGAGNARGAGYVGSANAWGQGIGGALNGFNEQALIDALLKRGN